MKARCEHSEHLFLIDLLEEDSRRAENLVLFDLDRGNSQRSENSVHYSGPRGPFLEVAVDKIKAFCSVFVYFERRTDRFS